MIYLISKLKATDKLLITIRRGVNVPTWLQKAKSIIPKHYHLYTNNAKVLDENTDKNIKEKEV